MKLIEFWHKHTHRIFILFILSVSVTFMVTLLPSKVKFKYEYIKGNPWMHEDLIAPYDFPIYKPAEEFNKEKDSLLRQIPNYFALDSNAVSGALRKFSYDLDSLQAHAYGNGRKNKFLTGLKVHGMRAMKNIYNNGIIETWKLPKDDRKDHNNIAVLNNNMAETRTAGTYFTPTIAYKAFADSISDYTKQYNTANLDTKELLKNFSLNKYIKPNLIYSPETEAKIRKSVLDNVSLTRGMVQAGQGIVQRGETVTPEIYKNLESLRREHEMNFGSTLQTFTSYLGKVIIIAILHAIYLLFVWNFRRETYNDRSKVLFLLLMINIVVLFSSITLKYNLVNLYLLPYAALPLIVKTFTDSRLAVFSHTITILIIGYFAPNGYEFIFVEFVAGMVILLKLDSLHRRNQLFIAVGVVILAYVISYFGLSVIHERSVELINWNKFLWFGGSGLLILIVFPLIFIIEKSFNFLSDLSLLELSDSNQPLLRLLSESAPGTFQHSMQVANLAESVVQQIGGNPLLARTGALYHDIGKMTNPMYFTENQIAGINIHKNLTEIESAQTIIAHVTDGVATAKKYNLPTQIVDFIKTHHGTGTTRYFVSMYKKNHPDQEINMQLFTYPGPKPFSIETGVVMMADSIEAASRSLPVYTEATINELVDRIIDYQVADGQFSETPLTFRDISKTKDILKNKLQNIYHARIQYPE